MVVLLQFIHGMLEMPFTHQADKKSTTIDTYSAGQKALPKKRSKHITYYSMLPQRSDTLPFACYITLDSR